MVIVCNPKDYAILLPRNSEQVSINMQYLTYILVASQIFNCTHPKVATNEEHCNSVPSLCKDQQGWSGFKYARTCNWMLILTTITGRESLPGMTYSTDITECNTHPSFYYAVLLLCVYNILLLNTGCRLRKVNLLASTET